MFENQGTIDVVEHDTQSGTAYGHANAGSVASIGASSSYLTEEFDTYFSTLVQDTPGACLPACLNDFSSAGGIPTYLDKYGATLAVPELRENPRVTGPDGGNTTFFLADSSFDDDDGDGCNSPTSTFITPCLDNPAERASGFHFSAPATARQGASERAVRDVPGAGTARRCHSSAGRHDRPSRPTTGTNGRSRGSPSKRC